MQAARIRTIARRALARARAPQGFGPAAGVSAPPEDAPAPAPRVDAPAGLLTAEDLAGLAPGTRLRVGPGTRVTPLAREEAWRRGLRFEEGGR